tara:strand:+ start:212 stop:427 length:216 start_codon:yes stop_codon:yes gene_type:complete
LRYVYFTSYKFHEKEIFDEMIEVDKSHLKDENIPNVVKYALRNIDGKVKYKINTIQNKDQKTIHYIITVEY